jgi:hypothetical protein
VKSPAMLAIKSTMQMKSSMLWTAFESECSCKLHFVLLGLKNSLA